jgi:filamentous hemagglutinin
MSVARPKQTKSKTTKKKLNKTAIIKDNNKSACFATFLKWVSTLFCPTPFRKLVYNNGKWKTMDGAGNMFVARGEYEFVTIRGSTYVGRVGTGHYNISHGSKAVDYAGHIRFSQGARAGRGQLKWWNNNSGHYAPTAQRAWQARLPLNRFTRY